MSHLQWKTNVARWFLGWVTALLGSVISAMAFASDASWMEDNADRFRNNSVSMLSLPGSHDAGMYRHDVDRMEIGVENLRIHMELAGITLFHQAPVTGVVESGDLLEIFDALMTAVRLVDKQCISLDIVVDVVEICHTFGLEDLVWGWVGEYYELATGKPGDLSITQNLDLYGQLGSGVRMFDLRPKQLGGNLFIHHSQGDIKDVGGDFSYELYLGFHVPCWEVPVVGGCFPGSNQSYGFGTFAVDAGGAVKSFSVTGPSVDEVLADVRSFMLEGHRELVILDFSHYWAGYNGGSFSQGDYAELVAKVKASLGQWLLTEEMLPAGPGAVGERLATARLPELIGEEGRVIAMFATGEDYLTDTIAGIWPSNLSALAGDGGWANKDDLDQLRAALTKQFVEASSDRFELFWTLTCQVENALDCSVRELAAVVNPHLTEFVDGLGIPNDNGNTVNEIWVDFAEETAATQIAIGLNPVAAGMDARFRHKHGAAEVSVWISLLSETETPLDALQVDIATLDIGIQGARFARDSVKDLNRDGVPDLLLLFIIPFDDQVCGSNGLTLTGRTYGGQRVVATDSYKPLYCRAL